ncbi:MAG: hypothetical protein PHV34_01050 [Verrucomicrobiae bacterium]|nr:hypothetical protein [Verrucomicrobiae bacterium]
MNQSCTPLRPQIGLFALSNPLEVGADRASKTVEEMAALFRDKGCEVVLTGCINSAQTAAASGRACAEKHIHAAVFAPVSWFEDYLALDFLEECSVPFLFRPLPGMETGALCGTQQLTCFLKQLEHPCHTVFGETNHPQCLGDSMTFLRAAALKHRLRRVRIGLAGHRVNGMTHTSANEFMLKKTIGPRIIHLDLPEMLQQASSIPEKEAADIWNAFRSKASKCEVSASSGIDSMRMHLAIRKEIERHQLDALAIGCYPQLMGRVCLSASLLADEGIPLACEGDVHGAVAQLILTLLSGTPTHNTDWLDPLEDGSVVFTHCGSGSLSLAEKQDDIRISSVRLMGQGACALFPSRPGPVTLLDFIPHPDGYQCALMGGEALPTQMVFPGNPLRVRFPQSPKQLIDWIHREGIGHHWMAAHGHWSEELRHWRQMTGKNLKWTEPENKIPA